MLAIMVSSVYGQETILVVNAQGPSQSMTPQIMRIVEDANRIQNKYKFILEFKPGGFESIGLKSMLEDPTRRIATITNATIESFDRGFVNPDDIVPVFSHGDACWAVITNFGDPNKGLAGIKTSGVKELVAGGPALGGATHLLALQLGKKYNIPVRYIVYRSNFDALVNMTADNNSINFIVERFVNYEQFVAKNPRLTVLGMACPVRNPDHPEIKTVLEQGIDSPYIFQFTVASKQMPEQKRKDIEEIFAQVTKNIGKNDMFKISDYMSPVFYNQNSRLHYEQSITRLRALRHIYAKEIKQGS
jgi:hypothetical protein